MIDPVDTVVCQGVELLDWLPEELLAWDLPELVPTADWVEAHVKLAGRDVAIPGPIDLNLTPDLRGLFDALDDPAIETITGVFGTQLGKTTFLYGALLSTIRQRPGPALLVMPTEPDAREVAGGVLRNWVLDCEPVKALLADGETSLTKEGYTFAGSSLYFGWSNSAASLARRACRYAFYDEVEKFPPFVGRESNPLKLGDARLRTFRHTTGCKSVRVSSPTDRTGLIGKSFEASDQRSFWVPCPACGEYQVLTWKQVVWPKGGDGHSADPDVIREEDLARYQCPHCQAAWDDARRIAAVRRGVWARRGQRVGRDGLVAGAAERPRSSHAGFHARPLLFSSA